MDTIATIIMLLLLFGAGCWINSLQNRLEVAQNEVGRWRSTWSEADRWFAEFPDVTAALRYLKTKVDRKGGADIATEREYMRARRDGRARRHVVLSKEESPHITAFGGPCGGPALCPMCRAMGR